MFELAIKESMQCLQQPPKTRILESGLIETKSQEKKKKKKAQKPYYSSNNTSQKIPVLR